MALSRAAIMRVKSTTLANTECNMDLEGSLADNLNAAIVSATRLQGHPVHKDTVNFWNELLNHARVVRRRARVADIVELEQLIAELETCVQEHVPG
jgi:hypothetical protein